MLPVDVAGISIVESPEAEAQALADPVVAADAERIAAGIAADAATGDFVYGVVVALRPGAMSDASFRAWRDSFDQGACSQAGGVVGHAEGQIGGRDVYIGSCAGGLHTYHLWLPARQRLISISALGDRRFGEQLVAGVRE
jgi:hypothetical protein